MKQWDADYVVIYQDSGKELDHKWEQAGFQVLSSFHWSDYGEYLEGWHRLPIWWLLKQGPLMYRQHSQRLPENSVTTLYLVS